MITTNSQGQPISQAFIDAVALPSISYKLELWSNGSKLAYEIQRATLELGTGYGVSGDTDFALGQASSSQLTAYLFDATVATGTQIEVRVGVEVTPDTYEFVSVANVTVESSVVAGQITTVKASGAIAHMTQTCSLSGWQTPAAIASELGITLGAFANTPDVYLEANLSRREALQALVRALGGQACEIGAQGVTASPYSSSATYPVPEDFIMKDPQLPEAYTVDGLTVTATGATYTYGTGRVKVNIPTCTQAGADALWSNVQGYTFTPGIVEVALIDPRVTPLDVLEVNFKGSTWNVPVQGISITYDGGYFGRYQSVGLSATQEAVLIQGPVEKAATQASGMAQQAISIAEATGQHFWHDGNGAHVTELPREQWEQQQTGPNSLWNSLGMLFRDGLNNLLAIVTGQNPGLQVYDGQGNTDENILAEFSSQSVRLGRGFVGSGMGQSAVEFFDGKTQLHALHDADSTTATNNATIISETNDADLTTGEGYIARTGIGAWSTVSSNNNNEIAAPTVSLSAHAGPELTGKEAELVLSASYDKNGTARRTEVIVAAENALLVSGNGVGNFTMKHVIDMLTVKTYDHTNFRYVSGQTEAYATTGANAPRALKVGRVVTLGGAIRPTKARTATGQWIIGYVPDDCKPLTNYKARVQASGMNTFLLSIETNGEIRCERYGVATDTAVPQNAWMNIWCTYLSAS